MSSENNFVVVDVETTGSRAGIDRIIEIAAVKISEGVVTDFFATLINPGCSIPRFIAQMTGITNEMVKDAPRFGEIADDVLCFLTSGVFVAHNAAFDYNFINAEFSSVRRRGISGQKLCTIKMARRIFPGLLHYNLRDLCRTLKIPHKKAHRAYDDALATAKLFTKMIQRLNRWEPASRALYSQQHAGV